IQADPASIQLQRDLALAHDKLGDLLRFNNDVPAAEASYHRAIAVREGLIRRHGQYPEVLRDLSVSANKLGTIRLRQGQYAEALAQFGRGLAYLDQFAPSYPSRIKVLEDYTYTYGQLTEASLMSDWTAGLVYARKSVESAQALTDAEPDTLLFRKRLAIAHQ